MGMKYEYGIFTVAGPYTPSSWDGTGDWPDPLYMAFLTAKMNELGTDRWEIFQRIYGPKPAKGADWPCTLWARRAVVE